MRAFSKNLGAATGIAIACVLAGCTSTTEGYVYGPGTYQYSQPIQVDPHYGREYRDGMEAVGNVMRPFAPATAPINTDTERSMDALRGTGTLLDLLNRSR